LNKPIFIVGPTCSGKNDFAYDLSNYFDIEIINADSIQVYKQLKILSNRPNDRELKIAPHHLYGHINNKEYSVNHWISDVEQSLLNIKRRNKIPVFVGGTGFYIQALIEGLSEMPEISKSFKKEAEDLFYQKGPDYCLDILEKYYKERIFPKDRQRLINRLAFCLEYNDIMENNYGKKKPITPNPLVIQVTKPKKDLYDMAESRFHKMISAGALEEVKSLHENKKISKTLLKAHGLPELLACVRNKMSLDDAIYDGIHNTKRYIKRQFTWWNNQKFSKLNLRINYKKSFPKDSIENISIYLNQ
jgi:tRNA dimethylallyltransferase